MAKRAEPNFIGGYSALNCKASSTCAARQVGLKMPLFACHSSYHDAPNAKSAAIKIQALDLRAAAVDENIQRAIEWVTTHPSVAGTAVTGPASPAPAPRATRTAGKTHATNPSKPSHKHP